MHLPFRAVLSAAVALGATSGAATPAALRALAADDYAWQQREFPVNSSDQGLHTWDDRLTDFSAAAIARRRAHVRSLLAQVRPMSSSTWARDDQVDQVLFRSQLERADFFARVQDPEHRDPQTYVDEASNGIFSLLKKEYAPPRVRALAATARLRAIPAMLEQGKRNLTRPVGLYAKLAIAAAHGGDALYTESLQPLAAALAESERKPFTEARDAAVRALHAYADWLAARVDRMPPWVAMGRANYAYLLRHVLLLPLDPEQVAMLGQAELARARAMEAMLKDPRMANPDPARAARLPTDQADFLRTFESREREVFDFVKARQLVTLPSDLGPFHIRQLPEAFKPVSPGGFMNPPGLYDPDPAGFYFIPTYDPKSRNFYIRASIEDPRPLIVHEGIPGHFVQISIANKLTDEIRRQQNDGVFIEGWALYLEELMMRVGFFADGSAAQGQVLRLSRYRAARVAVDVNLHTGAWTFEQAVQCFITDGGLDREAAEGEAAGAASSPSQKIQYVVGRWGVMRLLGRYRDRHPDDFRLGAFHDALLHYGSLPHAVIGWLMFDDPPVRG